MDSRIQQGYSKRDDRDEDRLTLDILLTLKLYSSDLDRSQRLFGQFVEGERREKIIPHLFATSMPGPTYVSSIIFRAQSQERKEAMMN